MTARQEVGNATGIGGNGANDIAPNSGAACSFMNQTWADLGFAPSNAILGSMP